MAGGEIFVRGLNDVISLNTFGTSENFIENPDTAVEAITIEDLLRMSSGLEWHEFDGGNSYMEWYNSNNHIDWVLDQEFIHEPGDGFNYNTGSIHLLSYILHPRYG